MFSGTFYEHGSEPRGENSDLLFSQFALGRCGAFQNSILGRTPSTVGDAL